MDERENPNERQDQVPLMVLDAIRWEFDADDKRHQSLTLRATVFLAGDVSVLALVFSALSTVGRGPSPEYVVFLERIILSLIGLSVSAAGICAALGLKGSPSLEVPNVDSFLNPDRYEMAPSDVARDFVAAYGDSVRSHRKLTEHVARYVKGAGWLTLTAVALAGILIMSVAIGGGEGHF